MRIRHIGICDLLGSTVFFYINLKRQAFPEKRYCMYNVRFDFLYTIFWNIDCSKNTSERYYHKWT